MHPWRKLRRLLRAIEDSLTVRQQIAFGTAILCLVLVAGLAGGAAYISREQATRLVGMEMRSLASTVSERLDASMFGRLRELGFLTTAEPMLARWRSDSPSVRRLLDEMQRAHPDFVWIGLVRPDGVVRAATKGEMEGVTVADQDWFKQALKAPAIREAHEDDLPQTGDEPSTPLPLGLIKIAYPVRDKNGLLIGVLGLHLSQEWTGDIRGSSLQPPVQADNAMIWVLDKDGSILSGGPTGSRPYSAQRLQQMRAKGHGTFIDDLIPGPALAGFAVTDGFRDYPGLGWIVVARRSLDVASAAWQTLVNSILALGAVLGVFGILMATLVAGRVSRPIRELTREADQIGRDNFATMLGRHSGSREVVDLSTSLRSLLRRVGSAEERTLLIEQRAAEETRKLAEDVDLLRSLAEADPVTGLLNRRAFASSSAIALAEFNEAGKSLGVLVIDIDHFKRVNDNYGHVAGDAVLRAVAKMLTGSVRAADMVSRYGGEEFVALLRDIAREDLRGIAETIRIAIGNMAVLYEGNAITVTVSIGASIAHTSDRDFEDLFQRADLALYTAKRNGRNQVQEAPPEHDLMVAAE